MLGFSVTRSAEWQYYLVGHFALYSTCVDVYMVTRSLAIIIVFLWLPEQDWLLLLNVFNFVILSVWCQWTDLWFQYLLGPVTNSKFTSQLFFLLQTRPYLFLSFWNEHVFGPLQNVVRPFPFGKWKSLPFVKWKAWLQLACFAKGVFLCCSVIKQYIYIYIYI